jgi:GNAT superfamily N-acetyltransferase
VEQVSNLLVALFLYAARPEPANPDATFVVFPAANDSTCNSRGDIKITDAADESTGDESDSPGAVVIRAPLADDETAVCALTRRFATSFTVAQAAFSTAFAEVLIDPAACFRVADKQGVVVGYVLGFDHQTFFASGRVAWVEEIIVAENLRGLGVGRTLMQTFENWARQRDCRLVALATRRAAGFYRSLEYVESATYFRKLLP